MFIQTNLQINICIAEKQLAVSNLVEIKRFKYIFNVVFLKRGFLLKLKQCNKLRLVFNTNYKLFEYFQHFYLMLTKTIKMQIETKYQFIVHIKLSLVYYDKIYLSFCIRQKPNLLMCFSLSFYCLHSIIVVWFRFLYLCSYHLIEHHFYVLQLFQHYYCSVL